MMVTGHHENRIPDPGIGGILDGLDLDAGRAEGECGNRGKYREIA
jgi:hypothetical protein